MRRAFVISFLINHKSSSAVRRCSCNEKGSFSLQVSMKNKARRLDAELAIGIRCAALRFFRRLHMKCCEMRENLETIKEYDPQPRNKDGSVRWFLYRWDDGKNGVRRLVQCRQCGSLYLAQAYHLNKFSKRKDTLFEDYYAVNDGYHADYLNRTCTGLQLEKKMPSTFSFRDE